MQTEVTKNKKVPVPKTTATTTNALATTEDFTAGGWDTETIDTKDLIIPKILLMHGMSDLVKKGERNQGEIIKSTTNEVLAKRGEKVEIIVFEKWKEWRIMKKNPQTQRFEFLRLEEWTPDNDDLAWEFTENGELYRRDKTLNFYGILANEAKTPEGFPVKISFSRTSFKSGMKLADAYTKALMTKAPPTRQTFKLGSELIAGKTDSYFIFTIEPGGASTEAQKASALQWRQTVMQAKIKHQIVDHEVDDEATTVVEATEF